MKGASAFPWEDAAKVEEPWRAEVIPMGKLRGLESHDSLEDRKMLVNSDLPEFKGWGKEYHYDRSPLDSLYATTV